MNKKTKIYVGLGLGVAAIAAVVLLMKKPKDQKPKSTSGVTKAMKSLGITMEDVMGTN
jgi:hypothetical protein